MSDTSKIFDITVAAGNGLVNTSYFDTPLGNADVKRVLLRFPYGCSGLVGVQLFYGNTTAYPFQSNKFLRLDDYVYVQEISNQPTGGNWGINAFNTDYLAHMIEVIYEYNYVRQTPLLSNSAPISL